MAAMLSLWEWLLVIFLLPFLGWGIFQFFWDRHLFRRRSDEDFIRNIRSRTAKRILAETPGIVPLDVRPRESHLAGRIPGSRNAPFVGRDLDAAALDGIPRDTPLLVYCDGGYRSRRALPAIYAAGFRRIFHLHRGILSWKQARLPMEKAKAT